MGRGRLARVLVWCAAGAVVASQIPYPLLPAGGTARAWLTVSQVAAFFVASAGHAWLRRGVAFTAGYLALALGLGLAVEVVGTRTGWPFGHYAYTGRLRPTVAGIPLIIPLAWAMMAYPALLVGRATPASRARRGVTALTGGALLAGWDLFVDPRMAAEGFWAWADGGGPRLNGIPLTNTAGWLLVGVVLVALLDLLPAAVPRGAGGWQAADGVPLFLLAWTYCSWVLACLAFFGEPAVALAGGVGMALPLLGLAVPRVPRGQRRTAPGAGAR